MIDVHIDSWLSSILSEMKVTTPGRRQKVASFVMPNAFHSSTANVVVVYSNPGVVDSGMRVFCSKAR